MPNLKTLFETPKKAAVTVACILVMLITLGTAAFLAAGAISGGSASDGDVSGPPAAAQGQDTPDTPQPGGMTPSKTLEEAREIALADAGLTASGAVFTGEGLEQDNGLWVYRFHFQSGTTLYEYEINANTGLVYSKSIERHVAPTPAPTPAAENTPQPTSNQPPEESDAPAISSASNSPDAEPSIAAMPETAPGMEVGSAYIGISQARSIALDHAGLTASQAMITKAAMDRDDGRMVYEIEFRWNGAEYEYKIDAQSGAILEHEVDRD